jgi:Protein of unknown function (DUF3489)
MPNAHNAALPSPPLTFDSNMAIYKNVNVLVKLTVLTPDNSDTYISADKASTGETTAGSANPKTTRTRENSKQAQMIELRTRPNGATLNEMIETTGWQAHTVLGAMAEALKKTAHHHLPKATDQERTYRISSEGVTPLAR